MTLYEIKEEYLKAMAEAFDEETGEIDLTKFQQMKDLDEDFNTKVENIICYIKNLKAEAEAIKNEKQRLADRQRVAENKAEALSNYLQTVMDGKKFESPKGTIGYRKSVSVEIDMDEFKKDENAELYLKYEEPKANKTAIKQAMAEGYTFKGVSLIEKQNIQIK